MNDETMPAPPPIQTTTINHPAPHSPSLITNKRWKPRRRGACGQCKLKKIRCDGGTPCVNCKRHNQECQYVLSKKRQSSKKSVGSVSSEKCTETRPQLDEMRNAATDVPIESPRYARRSPVPSHSSTGAANSPSVSDDQTTVRSLADQYGDETAWGVDMESDMINNLPPSVTDLSNVKDTNAFSWPLFATDTDWQFDFDIPFTAEHADTSTCVSSTALNDLDMSQFYNQPTQAFDATASSGELIGYLNLNDKVTEKVPTRGFIDPVPSINYSLKAIFSAQDRGLESISSAKQDEIDRIFKRISLVQTHLLSADFSDEQCHDGYATWYWNDAALIESCRNACFQQPLGISNFLTKLQLDSYMKDARGRSQGSSMLISLIDSVMAFGYQAFLTITQRSVASDERKKADYYSKTALRSRSSVLRSANTLLKLQTILAMITVSEHIDDAIHSELLAGAVSCARALKLENRDWMHNENTNSKDREAARRSLWFLFSVEVSHSLRRGISPALDHDWIDHAPPQAGKETDWFPLQCLYATVISSAAKMLYNQKALRQSSIEREQKLEMAFKLLDGWRNHLPAPLQEIHKHGMRRVLEDHQMRHIALSMFRQYHEAIFMIFFPWTGGQSGNKVSEGCRRRSMELCVNSAQVVLAIANQISSPDILDSTFLDLISVSICMSFLDVASSNGAKKSISYLSMGCGIFGRLNLDNEVPLADVLELTRTAQQIKGR